MTYQGNLHDSFSMLNGITIRISDKFSSPRKVILPADFSSSTETENLISYKYDFTKERLSVDLAKEERLMKEKQLNAKIEEELRNREEIQKDDLSGKKTNEESANNEQKILVPQVISLKDSPAPPKQSTQNIDFHEFESENVNPFELVELQTLNEKDELQRVLDPKSVKPQKYPSKIEDFNLNIFSENQTNASNIYSVCNTKSVHDFSLNNYPISSSNTIFSWQNIENPILNTTHNSYFSPTQSNLLTYSAANSSSFGNNTSSAQVRVDNIVGYHSYGDSVPITPYRSGDTVPRADIPIEVNYQFGVHDGVQEFPNKMSRTKSLPNLNNSLCDENVLNASFRLNDKEDRSCNKSIENLSNLNIDTNRINNIMQQYQFQRISQAPQPGTGMGVKQEYQNICSTNFSDSNPFKVSLSSEDHFKSNIHYSKANHENNTASYKDFSTDQAFHSANYHSANVFYPNDFTSTSNMASYTNNVKDFKNFQEPNIFNPISCSQNIHSAPNVRRLPSISMDTNSLINPVQKNILDQRVRSSRFPVLPHISTSQKPGNSQSWLIDETPSLSTSEKTFALQISAMGFPLPCVSRTIKRLGVDEKEVLDFLCLYEKTKESGHEPDSVEMGLVYCANKLDKVNEYLELVENFKKLGFHSRDIHNAIIEFSFDQDKVLDFLTR